MSNLRAIDWNKAVDYEYFDRIAMTAGTSKVNESTFFSGASARTIPETNMSSGKTANPFLFKAVRMEMYCLATTTGLTVDQVNDLAEIMAFSMLTIQRGTDLIFQCQTGRFFEALPMISEKGTAASLTGLFNQKRIVPLKSDVVIQPNDPISAIVNFPAVSASTTVQVTVAILGQLAKGA